MEITTKKLVAQSKEGNIESCEKLISMYDDIILRYALSHTHNNYDWAEEIAQNTRIKIFKSIHNFREQCAFTTWIHFIVKNCFLDSCKKQYDNIFCKSKNKVISLEQIIEQTDVNDVYVLADDTDLLKDFISKECKLQKKKIVNKILNEMSATNTNVIKKHYFEDKTYQDISDELCVPVGTVKSRLYRAKEKFILNVQKNNFMDIILN